MNHNKYFSLLPLGARVRYKHKNLPEGELPWPIGLIVSVNIHNQYVIETRDEHFIAEEKDWHIEVIPEDDYSNAVDYFYNETGDYTLTLFDEPIGIIREEDNAEQIKRYFIALVERLDFLQYELKCKS